ncbi:hypothetical protein [Alteraurantiacibacter palmitatis]|uniref:Uncharacterized protein n=1 Tax=Alteraurantiacibacter palmitatis TaxID=2054628 RepID=A0ABV7E921_9SPHN
MPLLPLEVVQPDASQAVARARPARSAKKSAKPRDLLLQLKMIRNRALLQINRNNILR